MQYCTLHSTNFRHRVWRPG